MPSALSRTIGLYRESFSGHPKEIWTLAILTFINRFGTMVLPFLTVYLTTVLDYSLKEAGALAGAFGFGSMAGAFLGGKLSDRFGPRFVIFNSMLISGVMLILLQWVSSFAGLFAMIFITSLFGESYRPALMAAVSDFVPKTETGRTMAFIRLAINLGFSAAPAIGGFVIAGLGYHLLFWIDGSTCIIAALYFLYASSQWRNKSKAGDSAVTEQQSDQITLPPFRNKRFLVFLLATFIMSFGFVQWFHSIPVFIKSEWGFDERYIGILMAMNGILITILEMPLAHSLEKAGKVRQTMLLGVILLTISFVPFLFPKALYLCFVAMLFMTLGEILHLPFNSSVALNLSPGSKKGNYMAWYTMSWSLAHITGPTLGLAFADYFGFFAFWVLIAILGLISWFIFTRISFETD